MSESGKIINVVSGKGGTGKTLFCSILAELLGNQGTQVLVVDLDVYVRGLTALLYFHKGEVLNILNAQEISVFDVLYNNQSLLFDKSELGIRRHRSFDILPAVNRIDQALNLDNPMLDENKFFSESLDTLINLIPLKKYDYVILDCRAGYDVLVSKIHSISDFSICVQEDDYISDVTANTLIKQLEKDNSQKPIFRIINKARNIHSFDKMGNGSTYIGRIPFDMDVMNSFGENSFWDDISKSLYKESLSEIWNRIAQKMELEPKLNFFRRSPLLNKSIEKKLGVFTLHERVMFIFGIIFTIAGFLYSDFAEAYYLISHGNPEKIISLTISLSGILIILMLYMNGFGRRK
ncbi:AAA family ATPase [Flavobacterium pallidum]|uniref:AAA domain-containing protein n=1 Tax=Flavobacterium pallidum TaxID=2172098 RepID=A0A2S1SE01_9FLAO|nr:AAA family ATPase [Flavobacterium pallidum]AWI24626.1 hypothetical protein HYN49_01260 [Flavobacterium pallidum]